MQLQISVFVGKELTHVLHFAQHQPIRFGQDKRCEVILFEATTPVAAKAKWDSKLATFTVRHSDYVGIATFPTVAAALQALDNDSTAFLTLPAKTVGSKESHPVMVLSVSNTRVLCQQVAHETLAKAPWHARFNQQILGFALLSLLLHGSATVALWATPVISDKIISFNELDHHNRFAKLIFEPPKMNSMTQNKLKALQKKQPQKLPTTSEKTQLTKPQISPSSNTLQLKPFGDTRIPNSFNKPTRRQKISNQVSDLFQGKSTESSAFAANGSELVKGLNINSRGTEVGSSLGFGLEKNAKLVAQQESGLKTRAAELNKAISGIGEGSNLFGELHNTLRKKQNHLLLLDRGTLAPEQVKKVITGNRYQIRACYEEELLRKPDLEGRIVVQFVIGSQGEILKLQIIESTVNSTKLEVCILKRMKTWHFSPPKNGTLEITYPFVFQAS